GDVTPTSGSQSVCMSSQSMPPPGHAKVDSATRNDTINRSQFLHTYKYMALKQLGDRLIRFVGGKFGRWRVLAIRPVQGDTLPQVERIAICRGDEPSPLEYQWALSGVISNIRYVERQEQQELTLKQLRSTERRRPWRHSFQFGKQRLGGI